LPNSVVDANSVNAFKACLDKFWLHQEVMFDFTADLSGTGNRSVGRCRPFDSTAVLCTTGLF